MATRRPIYRKEKPRSVSKTGLLLCLLLAGAVMLVPTGSGVVHLGKAKLRDLALSSGVIDFNDCVVTAERELACGSHASGQPLPAVLRQIEDGAIQVAAERQRRQKAESKLRDLALEMEQLTERLKHAELAAGGFFPPTGGEVRPTGLTGANKARPEQAHDSSFSLTPPAEEE